MVVVVGFDVFEDLGADVAAIDEAGVLEQFGFEGAHEEFGPGVMISVCLRRHTLAHPGLGLDLPLRAASVRAAPVAVEVGFRGGARPSTGTPAFVIGFSHVSRSQLALAC